MKLVLIVSAEKYFLQQQTDSQVISSVIPVICTHVARLNYI